MPTIQIQINDDDFNVSMALTVQKLLENKKNQDFLKLLGITNTNFKTYN